MKYQSEVIKEIVEARGHEKSSLHYESECIETWMEEAKGGYPKLCDYESEWLNYISVLDDTGGEFPYETITDVTEATVDNVVPYAYKSATLKGKTLVNLCQTSGKDLVYTGTNSITKLNHPIETNKWYYMIINVKQNTFEKPFRFSGWTFAAGCKAMEGSQIGTNDIALFNAGETGIKGFKLGYSEIVDGLGKTLIMFVDKSSGETLTRKIVYDIMFLEYQEGMENCNIPYFEGVQSVKMPVLTTIGKNLFDKNKMEKGEIHGNGEPAVNDVRCRTSDFIRVKGGSKITLSKSTNEWFRVFGYDNNKNFVSDVINKKSSSETFAIPSNVCFIKIKFDYTLDIAMVDNIQLEVGDNATSYEPFKSNILTVNEDVTLRSNGSVYDELDLLTGKLTQCIDEDGSVLTQEVVKTVELLVQNQDGKTLSVIKPIEGTMQLSTSSNTINPLFSGEIPVEAITQNLASFIDLEMEE